MTTTKLESNDPRKAWDVVEKRFNRLSKKEKAETLVRAGILTKNHKPRAPYKEVLASI
jgi:DNA/RNA endonuclease G (NUC1)